ncbi:uncharacterized protein phf11 isoform X2 [Nelusetta ayraudi]|uniref:uncharacterized protein phf11 isoform X2 n=1 Tax=Nelusetta ayraudi TaxID=303726 RepID=UPI003F709FAA
MNTDTRVSCVLCKIPDETKVTGALSTKEHVTAHQNCLLYASGIFCQSSPEFDDLFGFSVTDVLTEVKRGSKLKCSECKGRGATAGCEKGRCKKSFHYPCAIRGGAHSVENEAEGTYSLYCSQHWQPRTAENGFPPDQFPSTSQAHSSINPREHGPLKQSCLTCEKTEGNINLDSISDNVSLPFCDRHAPLSRKRNASCERCSGNTACHCVSLSHTLTTIFVPTGNLASASGSSSPPSRKSARNLLSYDSESGGPPAKHTPTRWNRIVCDSSDSDESVTDMEGIPPIESEGELQEDVDDGKTRESPAVAPKENQPQTAGHDDDSGEETDAESQSLLQTAATSESPVSTNQASVQTELPGLILELKKEAELVFIDCSDSSELRLGPPPAELPVPSQNPPRSSDLPSSDATSLSAITPPAVSPPPPAVSPPPHFPISPAPSPVPSTIPPDPPHAVHPTISPAVSPTPSSLFHSPPPAVTPPPAPPSATPGPATLPSDPEPSVDAAEFWRNCNTAECTQAIFRDFIGEMSSVSSRIISEEASQEDYDLALAVMKASGKLEGFVMQQQKELEKKQMQLQEAAASMLKAFSLLRR